MTKCYQRWEALRGLLKVVQELWGNAGLKSEFQSPGLAPSELGCCWQWAVWFDLIFLVLFFLRVFLCFLNLKIISMLIKSLSQFWLFLVEHNLLPGKDFQITSCWQGVDLQFLCIKTCGTVKGNGMNAFILSRFNWMQQVCASNDFLIDVTNAELFRNLTRVIVECFFPQEQQSVVC